ncbi:MAG: asparagine synthase [Lachnospiraceae bacterium]|nr:asparagine synthase [Lachnospiraceae bacterium]
MKVDKNYCMSSYLCFRYVADPEIVFKEGVNHDDHNQIPVEDKFPCKSADDIDEYIKKILEEVDLSNAAIFLSGGMDSAILASYMPKGTKAYTARCVAKSAIDETERAAEYCRINGLEHVIVDVTWDDYLDTMDALMQRNGSPFIPNEPQAYVMARKIKEDGAKFVIYGNCADTEFGGMDKLLSRDWDYDGWVERFTFLSPDRVLKTPGDVKEVYDRYRIGDTGIDFIKFMKDIYAESSSAAYTNACKLAGLSYLDPYEKLRMADPLDLNRVRAGESKYLLRELFRKKYPMLPVPEKLGMSRPAEEWMKDWEGPKREEFLSGCVNGLSGEQKLLLFSLERFLNLLDES